MSRSILDEAMDAGTAENDDALERFVLEDEGRHDEELIRLFHRRTSRYLMLCGPAGSAIARHNPIPDFQV